MFILSKVLGVEIAEMFQFSHLNDYEKILDTIIEKLKSDKDTTIITYKFLKSLGNCKYFYCTTLCKPCGLSTFLPNVVAISSAKSCEITTKQNDFTISLSHFISMLNFGVNLSFVQPIIDNGGL